MPEFTVALLSPGDMGHVVGRVLREGGARVLTCLEGRSERTRGLAHTAGIEDAGSYDKMVREAELLLSILVPAQAESAAGCVADALGRTGASLAYVDCNAIAPATARRIADRVVQSGAEFVDAGIIGGPPRKPGTTRFYCSGADTRPFERLNDCGLDVRVVGPEVGQASGFKMCYAAHTKGFTALASELLIAAERMGLYDALVEELEFSQAARYASMQSGVPSMPTKARRWTGEMEEIARTFGDLGLTPRIYQGAADIYRLVSDTPLADETPETRDRSRTLAQTVRILADSEGGEE